MCMICNGIFDFETSSRRQPDDTEVKCIGGMHCVRCLITMLGSSGLEAVLIHQKTNLFVVVRHDRHCEDTITVHITEAGAREAIEEFKRKYAEYDYSWEAREWDGDNGWLHGVRCHDDGPWARIEMKQVLR